MFDAAKAATEGRVSTEFLQPQIEVTTLPHSNMAAARAELRHLRQTVATVAAEHGLAILAAGTHPTALWRKAQQTAKARYDAVMHDLQMIGQRDLLCGLHVHVELPDPDERVDVMYRMLPYLPLFVALSTSSPFWQSRRTGLKGYRLAAYDELPRTGVPELFRTREEFDAYVQALVRAGVIEDSSYIWWAIRPSLGHPTLELRAPDCCTLVDDSIAIAALYRTLARQLYVNPLAQRRSSTRSSAPSSSRTNGARSATACTAPSSTKRRRRDHGRRDARPGDRGDRRDAEALGCLAEINRCRAIVGAGTSADAQLAMFEAHRERERPRRSAARGERLDRGGDLAVVAVRMRPAEAPPSAPPARERARRPPREHATRTA